MNPATRKALAGDPTVRSIRQVHHQQPGGAAGAARGSCRFVPENAAGSSDGVVRGWSPTRKLSLGRTSLPIDEYRSSVRSDYLSAYADLRPAVQDLSVGTLGPGEVVILPGTRAAPNTAVYFLKIPRNAQSPGLKAISICPFFRGLKPPAPSGSSIYSCSTKEVARLVYPGRGPGGV
jgi:hypothetical protein